jgi:hypothetical protein
MAEQQQARDAADRAQALVAMNATKDGLADLHDEVTQGVADGSVPKDKAAETYATKSAKLLSDSAAGIPEKHRAIGLAELNATAGRLGNGVRKAVTQRDRQDVTSGISQTPSPSCLRTNSITASTACVFSATRVTGGSSGPPRPDSPWMCGALRGGAISGRSAPAKTGALIPKTSHEISAFGSVRESGALPCTTVMPRRFA